MTAPGDKTGTWRDYQKRLHRRARKRYYLGRLPVLALFGGACFFVLAVIAYTGTWLFAQREQRAEPPAEKSEKKDQGPEDFSRENLHALLGNAVPDLLAATEKLTVNYAGTQFDIKTSIDPSLQKYISNLLNRSMTHKAAVVVLRADSGRVLAMANYENAGKGEAENLCLRADFPAASLFKIVAASAAIEAKGFTPETPLFFRGQKHTLYRSQLKETDRKTRYLRKTSLKGAFSGSINPVFGKIGIHDLGREIMTDYAQKFLFNQSIPFDLPLATSRIEVPEDPFGLAEIASGFNKRTLISPLHAALITAAVANGGAMMAPWLVGSVEEASGKILYQASPSKLASPVSEITAKEIKALMEETVISGTVKSAFRALRRKKAFKQIELGAKTGTINDSQDRFKYDWVIAYALPENGAGGLSLAILAVHGEKLGIRAKDLAKSILNHYFSR